MDEKTKESGAGTRSTVKKSIKTHFTPKRMSLMAVFVALSFAVSLFDFPIFPATPFLKLDFGNVFILLISFLLGPVEGVIVCVLKEICRMAASSSGGVGEIANMLVTSSYILLPSIAYRFRKGLKHVIPCLLIACVLGTVVALVTNRFINFPLYMGNGAAAFFKESFWFIVAFNFIKMGLISVLTLLLYKRMSNFLKRMKI